MKPLPKKRNPPEQKINDTWKNPRNGKIRYWNGKKWVKKPVITEGINISTDASK